MKRKSAKRPDEQPTEIPLRDAIKEAVRYLLEEAYRNKLLDFIPILQATLEGLSNNDEAGANEQVTYICTHSSNMAHLIDLLRGFLLLDENEKIELISTLENMEQNECSISNIRDQAH